MDDKERMESDLMQQIVPPQKYSKVYPAVKNGRWESDGVNPNNIQRISGAKMDYEKRMESGERLDFPASSSFHFWPPQKQEDYSLNKKHMLYAF